MEKRRPHYDLSLAVELSRQVGRRAMTVVAVQGAAALGFDARNAWRCVQGLAPADFYKSMTTIENARIWQDVYRTRFKGRTIYLKLQLLREGTLVRLVSFKEDESK